MSIINKNNFLRWSTVANETDPADPAKGYIWDKNRCNSMPVLVAGESMFFYINTSDTLTFNPTTVKLNLIDAISGDFFEDVSPLIQHIYDTDTGDYTFYAQVVIDNTIPVGIYYFAIIDEPFGIIISNYIQILDSAGNYKDYTTLCTFRHDRYFYGVYYNLLPDFSQQFRLILNEVDMQPESDKEVYNEVTTGKQRTYNAYLKLLKKIETYYFDDEAHKAATIMFDSSQLFLNGRSYVPKAVYKILRNVNGKLNKGEIELYDEDFASVNRCTDIPAPIIPPPPVCIGVALTGTPVLPPMNNGEAYFYSFNFTGDLPAFLSDIVVPLNWSLIPNGNTINLSGTYDGDATSLDVAFTLSNCNGANSFPFSGTITVNHPTIPIAGAITFSCSDDGCSHQGFISIHIEFAQSTPMALNMLFGQVTNTGVGQKYTGNDIFTPPGGSTPEAYYSTHNNLPFSIDVPGGINIGDFGLTIHIYQQGRFGDDISGSWICHSCLFPINDLYVKVNQAGYSANFTLTNVGATIHNV